MFGALTGPTVRRGVRLIQFIRHNNLTRIPNASQRAVACSLGPMKSFVSYYRTIFRAFGYPRPPRAALSAESLAAVAQRLRIRIPAALRDYYLIAGNERRFNTSHNRLLPPSQWTVDKGRLIFMEENQRVVLWGVSIRNPDSRDPPVSQGINDEPISWHREHRSCSVFLAVMLHYQAVCGGLRHCASGDAPDESSYRFAEHGWTHYGEVNALSAYSRPNQVVCVMPPGDLPFMQKWRILAGGKTRPDLVAIGKELEVAFDQ
jgi:hypothetical protein